jgi:flavin reductase (DIM6/NTAB) family NADH-FMN oxidoreductase RutF
MKIISNLELVDDILKMRPLLYLSSSTKVGKVYKVNLSVYANYITVGRGRQIWLESSLYKKSNTKTLKDTILNVRNNKWLVLNIPFKNLHKFIYLIAKSYSRHVSEAEALGIEIEDFDYNNVKYPLIKSCNISIVCSLIQEIQTPRISDIHIIILKPTLLLIDDKITTEIYPLKQLIAREGIYHYGSCKDNSYYCSGGLTLTSEKKIVEL